MGPYGYQCHPVTVHHLALKVLQCDSTVTTTLGLHFGLTNASSGFPAWSLAQSFVRRLGRRCCVLGAEPTSQPCGPEAVRALQCCTGRKPLLSDLPAQLSHHNSSCIFGRRRRSLPALALSCSSTLTVESSFVFCCLTLISCISDRLRCSGLCQRTES